MRHYYFIKYNTDLRDSPENIALWFSWVFFFKNLTTNNEAESESKAQNVI